MIPLTAEEIAELRRLDREAAPLPWRAERTGHEEEDAVTRVIQPRFSQNAAICGADSDGQFIATARNALPRLLDEVERSRKAAVTATEYLRGLLKNAGADLTFTPDGPQLTVPELERSRALLKRIEWSANLGQNSYGCAECQCEERQGHGPGCEFAALLGAA